MPSCLPLTVSMEGSRSPDRTDGMCVWTPQPMKFADTDGTCLVELRSTGQQTIVPPSVHHSGEPLLWECASEPAAVDGSAMERAVAQVAAASLLARHWPARGSRHEAALALHGLLLRSGWTEGEAEHFVGAVAAAARDEEWHARAADARTTAKRLAEERTATGSPRLAEIFGKGIVDRVSTRLGFRQKHAT